MEYTQDLEKRVQLGKNDTNPSHDVIKLRVDKGKYLYFVPRYDGKYEFCSNDASIQEQLEGYDTQVLKKRFQCFKVLDRVKSDLGIMDGQPQNVANVENTEPKVPFVQSRLAASLKKSGKQDLQTLNQTCLKLGYELHWQDPTAYPVPRGNPTFKGNLVLHDKKSGKDYVFISEMCSSKKEVQKSICAKIFVGARSNSNTVGEPTKEQQDDIDRKRKETLEKIMAEKNLVMERKKTFELKKQEMIDVLKQNKIDVNVFKEFRRAFDEMNDSGQSSRFYTVIDDVIEKNPEIKEALSKTVVAAYGFSLSRYAGEERSDWNSESENFFLKHQDCIKYVQKEFDVFVEPYQKEIAQWKAFDELAPTRHFFVDVNDGWKDYKGDFHTLVEERTGVFVGSDFNPVSSEYGERKWKEFNVLCDENGERINEERNKKVNSQIARVYGVDLYEKAIPTTEQKERAQKLVDIYKEDIAYKEHKQSNKEKIRALRFKKMQMFMAENSISEENFRENIAQAIDKMEVIPSDDNYCAINFEKEYTLRNSKGNEYKLSIFNSMYGEMSIDFGPFTFSAKLTSAKKDYDPEDGAVNKVFEHELKQAVHAKDVRFDALVIDAALRKVGILGHPSTIEKKIKEGQIERMEFVRNNFEK